MYHIPPFQRKPPPPTTTPLGGSGKRSIQIGSAKGETFIDHKDKGKRAAWYARHSRVQNKQGQFFIPYTDYISETIKTD
jgi:hypothetical protein